jgi:hypothetical protein
MSRTAVALWIGLPIVLLAWMLWPEQPDSREARAEVERRFGENAHRIHNAYYRVPWNFVGHAPVYFRCRYEDESLVLSEAHKKQLASAESLRLVIPASEIPWWRSEGQVWCMDRTRCFDLERKILFAYQPGQ